MSTLAINYETFLKNAEKLTFLQEQDNQIVTPILASFGSIKKFMNASMQANLKSYRAAYSHLIKSGDAPRYRLRKLVKSRQVEPSSSLNDIQLRELIKDLTMIEYNIDFECKAKTVAQEIIYNATELLASNHQMEDQKASLALRSTLTMFDFRNLYSALYALKFNPTVHSASQIKHWDADGAVMSFNLNNKMFNGLHRLVGGLRVSYLRNTANQTKERFTLHNSDEFKDKPTKDIVAYALKVTSHIRRHSAGQAKQLASRLQQLLADDLIYATF